MGKLLNIKIFPLMVITLALLLMATVVISILVKKINVNSTVMQVNEEAVSRSEFIFFFNRNVTNTYSYFYNKYRIEDSKDFWRMSIDGVSPLLYTKEKTKEDIINSKIELILAKKYGLINDITWSSFTANLEKVNAARREAVKNNQVIYGPVNYGESEYYDYLISNLQIKLIDRIKEVGPSDDEMAERKFREYIDEMKKNAVILINKHVYESIRYDR